MKKSFIAAFIITTAGIQAFAQNNKVVSANMYLQDYAKDNDSTALKNAKAAIDEAAQNDKTKNEPKMFLYRGEVYKTIYEKQLSDISKKILMNSGGKMDGASVQKANSQAYTQADTAALGIAAYSLMQVIQLEPKGGYADEARMMLVACGGHMQNKAIADYNKQNYASAMLFFERVYMGLKGQGIADTTKIYVSILQNTTLTATKAKNYAKALKYNNEMITHKVGGALPYTNLMKMYTDTSYHMLDTNKAIDIVKQGRAAYPKDFDLLISETNIYMWKHDNEHAISNLQAAIDQLAKDPKAGDDPHKQVMAQLYSAMGSIYDKMANPRDPKTNEDLARPANYDEVFGKAEDSYKKALEQRPDYFEVNFNIGALYNNRAKQIYTAMQKMSDKEQAAKGKAMADEAKGWLTKAQPYLEKAHDLRPDDTQVTKVLRGLYASTGQEDKANALKGK